MSEWQEVTIDYICKNVFSGGTPLTSKKEFYLNGNIPWLKTKEVNQCRIFSTENYISRLGLENSSAKLVPVNSVTVAMYGDGQTAGRVGLVKVPLATNQACCNLVIDEKIACAEFVFYHLIGAYDDLVARKTGSGQQNLNASLVKAFEINLPTLHEQKAIAAVLSSLDDKIDLLHRQNATLESMAETLFRQWFVVEAGEDWAVKPLRDFVKVIDNRGKTPPYQDISTPYPIIEVNALTGGNRLVDYSAIRKYVSEDTFNTWFRGHPKKYDSLISTVGSIGEISMYLIEKGSIAQNVVALSAINISPIYLFECLKSSKDEIKELDIGSVQPSIKVPHLLSIKIAIPPVDKLKMFDIQVEHYLEKMFVNYNQIRTLEKLRDNLLPKLMSGEARVS